MIFGANLVHFGYDQSSFPGGLKLKVISNESLSIVMGFAPVTALPFIYSSLQGLVCSRLLQLCSISEKTDLSSCTACQLTIATILAIAGANLSFASFIHSKAALDRLFPEKREENKDLARNAEKASYITATELTGRVKPVLNSEVIAGFVGYGMISGAISGLLLGVYAEVFQPSYGFFPLLLSANHPDFGKGTPKLVALALGPPIGAIAGAAFGVAKEAFSKYYRKQV